ncbi:hypothetical protein JJQ73_00345 [Corynebacterium glutamicum]|uniref:hypothetical protein n=1 Tax=Corynebacterium glutamicum TaxID=1718 RepID=UPI001C6EDEA2|nr:hypothetical protein [Corynebacterium glutamicum]QYR17591.1 hypothetical protein JJQ73_00345 [Corynebacterium glutamicum]
MPSVSPGPVYKALRWKVGEMDLEDNSVGPGKKDADMLDMGKGQAGRKVVSCGEVVGHGMSWPRI